MGGVISKRLNQGIIDLKQLEDLRKAKLLQIGVFVIGVLLILLLFIWSYTKITLKNANCSTIEYNFDPSSVSDMSSLSINEKMSDPDNMTDYGDDQDISQGKDKRKKVGDYRLRDFYIKTAYNCCASGSYAHDFVDMCALENCIKLGARCLDFEIYSFDGKPIIAVSSEDDYHIKETYNYLDFNSVMEKIRYMAFNSSIDSAGNVAADPMILHFRLKTTNEDVFNTMAESIYNNFSDKMLSRQYSYEYNGKDLGNAKIKDLVGKIVIIVNKVNDSNNSVINIENTKLYEYVNVISGTENMRFYRLDKAKLSGDIEEIKNYNKERLSIVLPNKSNIPSNIDWREMSHKGNPRDPAGIEGYGVQFIGQCFQYKDAFLEQYHNDFNKRGGAFVLKPKLLRKDNPTVIIEIDTTTAKNLENSGANLQEGGLLFNTNTQ